MSITEEERHQLIRSLERTLGEKEAASLMELVPKVPWHEIATKRDLDDLEARLISRFDARFAEFDGRFAEFDARFAQIEARFAGTDASIACLDARFDVSDARTEAAIASAINRQTFRLLAAMATMIAIFGAIAATF